MAPPSNRSGSNRKAQLSVFTGYVIAGAGALIGAALLVISLWQPQARAGLLPLWAGLPLGAFDDLFSGQPFGSGILLFSVTLIAIELLDIRFPWRGFWQDWMLGGALLAAYLVIAALVSGAEIQLRQLGALLPQFLLSLIAYPILARMVSLLDRLRLLRIRRLG